MSELTTDLSPAEETDPSPPWQGRFEVLAALLVVTAVLSIGGALASGYALGTQAQPFSDGSTDWIAIIERAGQGAGITAAAAVLVAYLLVTLGPGDAYGNRALTVLRSIVVVGLVAAGLAAFAGLSIIIDTSSTPSFANREAGDSLLHRLGTVAPLGVAVVLGGYTAWCAFAMLGELVPPPVAGDAEPVA